MSISSTMCWNSHKMSLISYLKLRPHLEFGIRCQLLLRASLVAQRLKLLPAMWETWVWSLGREDPLEKEMATHSSTLAWRIPWTEEPGRLQSTGLQRVGHDWATSLSLSTRIKSMITAATDLKNHLKGVQGGDQEWGNLCSEKSWQNRPSNRYFQILWAPNLASFHI